MNAVVSRHDPAPVVQRRDTSIVVTRKGGDVVVTRQIEARAVVVTRGIPGPQGRPGEPGPAGGAALQRLAGEPLSALRVVWEDELGYVRALDASDEAHVFRLLGLTSTAAQYAEPVNVMRSGVMEDDSWNWLPGARLYLGASGAVTSTPPTSGFDVLIGTALSPKRIALNLQDPIEME